MAARKTRPPSVSANGALPARSVPPPADIPQPKSEPPRGRLRLAVGAFAVWLIVLVGLAIWSANPVTMNRQQVREADVVVEAVVITIPTGECRVVRAWPPGAVEGTITVQGLGEVSVVAGETYLIPLVRTREAAGYDIAPTHLPDSPRLIYPATTASRQQIEDILSQR